MVHAIAWSADNKPVSLFVCLSVCSKAIKHYMLDLCVCVDRFDSWAGMALARHSRLENKLSAVSLHCLNMYLVVVLTQHVDCPWQLHVWTGS